MGSGVRVPIRLAPETKLRGGIKGVGGISLFPGAIVALRGRNGGGGFFLVEELLSVRYTPSIPKVFLETKLVYIPAASSQNAPVASERCQRCLFHVYRVRAVQPGLGFKLSALGRLA